MHYLSGYMNQSIPRVGYYACTLSSLCGAGLLFLVGWGRQPSSPVLRASQLSHVSQQLPPPCACPPPPRQRLPKSQSLHVPLDIEQEIIRDQPQTTLHPQYHEMPEHNCIHSSDHYCQSLPYHHHTTLRPSKSVPEGLHGNHDTYRPRPRRYRDVTVIEQITTSVWILLRLHISREPGNGPVFNVKLRRISRSLIKEKPIFYAIQVNKTKDAYKAVLVEYIVKFQKSSYKWPFSE